MREDLKEVYEMFVEKKIFTNESPWLMAIKAIPVFSYMAIFPFSGTLSKLLNTNQLVVIGLIGLVYGVLFFIFKNYFFKYYSGVVFFGEYYLSVAIIIFFTGLSVYLFVISVWTFVVQIALIVLAAIFVYTALFGNKKVQQK